MARDNGDYFTFIESINKDLMGGGITSWENQVYYLDKDGAFRTRSFMINIDPTEMELVEYMGKLAPSIQLEDGLNISLAERQEVVEVIKTMIGKRGGLSLRNLVRGLNIRASGISDWENITRRYA